MSQILRRSPRLKAKAEARESASFPQIKLPDEIEAASKSRGHSEQQAGSWWLDGFAGVSKTGMFGFTPEWVDTKKPPGNSNQTEVLGWKKTLHDAVFLRYFFMSPNLVWFSMALFVHAFFPYDIESAKGWQVGWVLKRLALNFSVAFPYYAFFHIGLYYKGWGQRKFRPGTFPTAGNMAHNLYYWSLGVLQWTWWEAVMMRLWATGTVKWVSNEDILGDRYLLTVNLAWVLLIPLWRDLHFYIAHRFCHIRAVYKYVHSLHHRNADPEPFSGMTMHPIEHLYYFSNAFTPSLYCSSLSPLIFLWNFLHLTIAPGAGHSGFEDHFQADQYHYVHHAKFECNYGSPFSAFIDQYFGTFREKLGTTKEYKGEYNEAALKTAGVTESVVTRPKEWSPQGYLGFPATSGHAVYTIFWVLLFPLCVWGAALNNNTGAQQMPALMGVSMAQVVAATVSYGPVIFAMAVCLLEGDRMSWRWPFHKEPVVGAFGLFFVLGWVACILPIYHATLWACQLQV
mmetsp:Transcript_9529/g.18067  ORF Transcript_9529/g.18067 Transcript_9529/m.18067 type:complete len:511 (-) Transcript_9529:134-1666(-)